MLSIILACCLFLLPIFLLVGSSELHRKYRMLKQEAAENPGTVSNAELKKWKLISIFAKIVFWTVIAMIVAIPALFFVAISFM
jgi:hypothetical protein